MTLANGLMCNQIEVQHLRKSSRNSTNRGKLPYNHTSEKIRLLSRHRKMSNPSKVEQWRSTHVKKDDGLFVNYVASDKYQEMMNLDVGSVEEGKAPISEDEILLTTLGHQSGYLKVMEHGVEVSRGFNLSTMQHYSQLSEKLSETQVALDGAKDESNTLTEQLVEQMEKNKSFEEKIESLQVQMKQVDPMRQFG